MAHNLNGRASEHRIAQPDVRFCDLYADGLDFYSERYTGRAAILGILAALLVGGLLFPDPAMTRGSLLGTFAAAIAVSVAVSLALTPRRSTFDLRSLENVRYIED